MESPFPKSSSSAGGGRIVARCLPAGGSGLEALVYQYPLKLISPSASVHHKSVLVFLLSYGGGLVGGDKVNLSVHVQPGARLSLVTQGHTKVFKSASSSIVTTQTFQVQLDDESALCLLPDPVQPFQDSVYSQTQIFNTTPAASLCLLDWVTQGRAARGENWSFVNWTGRNEIWLRDADGADKQRLLVRDIVKLSADGSTSTGQPLSKAMHGLGVCGTLLLQGRLMEGLGAFFQAEFSALPRLGGREFRSAEVQEEQDENESELERWRSGRIAMEKGQGVVWSAAQVRGCTVVKFAAPTVEVGREWIAAMLMREGSVETHFGEPSLMCLR